MQTNPTSPELAKEIVDVLEQIQYNGKSEQWTHISVCPYCQTIKPDGNGNSGKHSENCKLNNLLKMFK